MPTWSVVWGRVILRTRLTRWMEVVVVATALLACPLTVEWEDRPGKNGRFINKKKYF
jgi:hypothetical protein